jgi:hypothetical protein
MAIPLRAFVTTRFDTHRWPESIPAAGASLVEGHDGFARTSFNCRWLIVRQGKHRADQQIAMAHDMRISCRGR